MSLHKLGDRVWGESDRLNADFVGASPDPKETFLSPGRSPGVLHDPELLLSGGFNSVANDQHGVIDLLRSYERDMCNFSVPDDYLITLLIFNSLL